MAVLTWGQHSPDKIKHNVMGSQAETSLWTAARPRLLSFPDMKRYLGVLLMSFQLPRGLVVRIPGFHASSLCLFPSVGTPGIYRLQYPLSPVDKRMPNKNTYETIYRSQ